MKETMGDREREVLKAVVENHINDPSPVASRTLSRNALSDLKLSPATIRNIMADLDERGFIAQPHPSAGRVPTDKGYRFYIEELMTARSPAPREKKLIDSELARGQAGGVDIPQIASGLLVRFSNQAGIILFPRFTAGAVRRFHFIKLSVLRVQVVLVMERGEANNIVIATDEDYAEPELTELANYINHNFSGKTLKQIRMELRKQAAVDEAEAGQLERRALRIQEQIASRGELPELLVDGVPGLLDAPEFQNNAKRLQKILKLLEDKRKLLAILDRCFENRTGGVVVEVGREFDHGAGIEDCAMVARSYGSGGEWDGAIGVIGPRRMDYPYMVGLLNYFSTSLNGLIAGKME